MKTKKNKKTVVLITGCSSGIGLSTAAFMSQKINFRVYATMRNLKKKNDLLDEVERYGGRVKLHELDLVKPETIRRTIDLIERNEGRLDVVVNNAGYVMGGFFEDLSEQEIREQQEILLFGPQNVIRAALPLMHASGEGGRIINISSIAGLMGVPGGGAYVMGKWGLEGLSETLRLELSQFGIKVCLVEPGSFKSKIRNENSIYSKNTFNPESKYYPYTEYLTKKRIEVLNKIAADPIRVAKLIDKLIKKKNPPLRSIIGRDAKIQFFIKRILPYSLFERIMQSVAFKKKKSKTS